MASGAKRVTDGMFLEAARILSKFAPILHNPYASLFPRLNTLPTISKEIAIAVANMAIQEGMCDNPPSDIEKAVEKSIWTPKYAKLKKMR